VASEVSPAGPYQLQEVLLSVTARVIKIAINVFAKQSPTTNHSPAVSNGAADSHQADGV